MKTAKPSLNHPLRTSLMLFALALPGGYAVAQSAAPAAAPEWPGRNLNNEMSMKITAPFTLATVGDIIEPQPLTSQEPGYQQLINLIRNADVGFGNMESSLVDIWRFQGTIGGTEAPLETGQAIKDMGIKMMNHANNHTFNGGVEGMMSTDAELDKLGIVHAGTGKDLTEARSPKYLETPKGRVGLVGMFSIDDVGNYGPNYSESSATYRVGDVGGTAGTNTLHLTDYHIVSAEQMQSLRALKDAILGASPAAGDSKDLKFYDDWYRVGPEPGTINYVMNPRDEQEILKSIHDGKLYSEFMIATIHAHQTSRTSTQGTIGRANPGGGGGDAEGVDHVPPDFLIKLAHDSIDNGADIFVAHGVHALHGIEVYKGKPILYGISNFVFQFGLQYGMMPDPSEDGPHGLENPASQETVLVTSHYEGGKLTEIRVYPVDLGGTKRTISRMGIPMTPSPEIAQRILKEMQDLSKPYGTNLVIENNVGVIRVAATSAAPAKH